MGVVPPVDVILDAVPVTLDTVADVVAKVPEVGNVTLVGAVIVKVDEKAPDVVKLPPSVIVLAPLFMPVPPLDDARGIDESVMPPNVGVLPAAISCGKLKVIAPLVGMPATPFTNTWLVVPVADKTPPPATEST